MNWRFTLNSKTDELCRWHAVWKGKTFHCWNLVAVLTCLTASILLLHHRNPDEKSEIAAEKEEKQRCGKPQRDQQYCVSLPKGIHATTLSVSCQSLSKTGPLANPIQWQREGCLPFSNTFMQAISTCCCQSAKPPAIKRSLCGLKT